MAVGEARRRFVRNPRCRRCRAQGIRNSNRILKNCGVSRYGCSANSLLHRFCESLLLITATQKGQDAIHRCSQQGIHLHFKEWLIRDLSG
jgi:hypothetical protein